MMRELLEDAAERGIAYLEGVGSRSVTPRPEAVAGLAAFDERLPRTPTAPGDVLALLDELGSPATMAMAGPRFFGFVIGGSLPATVAANWLATAWDQNAGALHARRPPPRRSSRWRCAGCVELLGLPPATRRRRSSPARTMANFTALAAARHAVLARAGWDVEADGLFGAPPITVIVGDEAHPTLLKALGLLGLGRERVVTVPVDGQGRMRADALPRDRPGPTIVCVQAGNVNTGAFDPRRRDRAPRRTRPPAPGCTSTAPSACGPRRRRRARTWCAGIGAADSWATDAHKWLNVPYDSGLAFVRDPSALRAAMAITAAYLPDGERLREPVGLHARAVAPRARRRGVGGAARARAAAASPTSSSATAATRGASPRACARRASRS